MSRIHPIYFDVPTDLWEAFKANAPTSGPLPHLRLVLEDLVGKPHALTKTIDKLLRNNTTRGKTMVSKGVRWPKETWDNIEHLSNILHTTKVAVIRLAMEHDLHPSAYSNSDHA